MELTTFVPLHQSVKKLKQFKKLFLIAGFFSTCSYFLLTTSKYPALLQRDDQLCSKASTPIEERFCQRRQHLLKACREHYGSLLSSNDSMANYRSVASKLAKQQPRKVAFFVDDENHVLTCAIPKVGSTNWKRLLLYLASTSNSSLKSIEHDFIHNNSAWPSLSSSFKPLSLYRNESEIVERLANYTKIIWVRHPLQRLVSAWYSKIKTPSKNPFYGKVYSRYIIENYRRNYHPGLKTVAGNEDSGVKLEEFFEFISREVSTYGLTDVHWSLYNVQCMPCFIDFDYIAKLESWEPEAGYLLSKIFKEKVAISNNDEVKDELKLKKSQIANIYDEEIKHIPQRLLSKVLKTFSFDFQLFDYKKPSM